MVSRQDIKEGCQGRIRRKEVKKVCLPRKDIKEENQGRKDGRTEGRKDTTKESRKEW